MRLTATLLMGLITACSNETDTVCTPPTQPPLFGRPSEKTGLTTAQCQPSCSDCDDGFEEAAWTSDRVAQLREWTLEEPVTELSADPYLSPPGPAVEGSVCAVQVVDSAQKRYRLETYESAATAEAAAAIVTHGDACGLCSTLQDLAVYAEQLDLTDPVRSCGIANLSDHEGLVSCIEALGFSLPCAQIWAYNTEHTRDACLEVCLELLGQPYHEENGELNACLRCDEEQSGAVFKSVAGRTRRNTGIASSLCRPCAEVYRLEHAY